MADGMVVLAATLADHAGGETSLLTHWPVSPALVIALVVGALLVLAMLTAVAVLLVHRARRRLPTAAVGSVLSAVGGKVDAGRLALRARQPGTAGELARLRLRVHREAELARDLTRTAAEATFPSRVPALAARVAEAAASVDDMLQRLEREPDPAAQSWLLADARERTRSLLLAGMALRGAAGESARSASDDELAALLTEIQDELATQRQYVDAYRELGGGRIPPTRAGA